MRVLALQNESIDDIEKAPFEEGRFTVFALISKLRIRNLYFPNGDKRGLPPRMGWGGILGEDWLETGFLK